MEYLEIAKLAAVEAGKIHKKYFGGDFSASTKSSSFDIVTVADVESEKAIVSKIKEFCPDHNFLGEENSYEKTSSEYTWIIDPLDGTNNFASGLPIFGCSIALAKKDTVIAGVVYNAVADEMYYASVGGGAFLNSKPIHVSNSQTLQQSILITGFYYDRGQKMIDCLERIKQFFFKPIMGLRRLGAAALDLCFVAAGRAAGFWEFELNPWDFAAGILVVAEAGGLVTDKENNPVKLEKSYIVASNSKIHSQMLEVLNA